MKTVTAAIFRNDQQVLIFKRALGEKLEGMWEFPGGKVEEKETLESCLVRELSEELNIQAVIGKEIGRSRFKYSHGEIELVALEVLSFSGEIKLSVHDEMQWMKINELSKIELAPADIGLIDYLLEN